VAILIPLKRNHNLYRHPDTAPVRRFTSRTSRPSCSFGSSSVVIFGKASKPNRCQQSLLLPVLPWRSECPNCPHLSKLTKSRRGITLFLVGRPNWAFPSRLLLASAESLGLRSPLSCPRQTPKTLFGTLNLLSDKPFRVAIGNYFKHYDGVVRT